MIQASSCGMGLLGISGIYRTLDEKEQNTCLEKLIKSDIPFIDTASVYGIGSRYINPLLAHILATHQLDDIPIIINKLGANLMHELSVASLIHEFEQEKVYFKGLTSKLIILLHRPTLELLERDLEFYQYIKDSCAGFGLSTNNLAVFESYQSKLPVQYLQIAVNLLDYHNSQQLLQEAHIKKVHVMARSVLASGLLSGKYSKNGVDNFTDALRIRYRANAQTKDIYYQRIEKVKAIIAYYNTVKARLKFDLTLSQFIYQLVAQSPYVDSVVMGGSNAKQITENCHTLTNLLPTELVDDVFNKQIKQWAAPYL